MCRRNQRQNRRKIKSVFFVQTKSSAAISEESIGKNTVAAFQRTIAGAWRSRGRRDVAVEATLEFKSVMRFWP
jgi:hypothetical protein